MDENILIEVSDNGLGVDPKDIPRLFERFFRVDKSRSREQGGSGLGLSIVKHIIEAHHQTINVRSTMGVGTTFAFTLQKSDFLRP
jgi:two-component system phosphate regulon sensor histidine kinase PhoR